MARAGRGRGRRWRAPLAWLALAALAAGIVAMDRAGVFAPAARTDSHGHALDRGPRYLVRLPAEQLTAAEIVVGGTAWRFDRDETGAWRHGDGDNAGASARIENAIAVLTRAQITREITGERDVKAYGVLAPEISVLLHTGGGTAPAARFYFGDLAPDELSRYVLIFGEFLVVTVPEYHTANLVALTQSFAPREGAAP